MNWVFDIFILIVSLLIIFAVLLQSSKDDINDAFTGSKSELFKNQKTRGADLFLLRVTIVLSIAFFALIIFSRMQNLS